MVRVACAANLQKISELLQESWGFSIALDSATHQSTSYLDLRFRLYSKKHRKIYNVHGCALPLHDRHTGEVMFNMLTKFLDVLCPNWKVSMLGVATDGARNMTGRAVGVVTRLQQAMHPKCPMLRIWCGAHQLDLVMEHVMKKVVNESFFSIMLSFITHLSRQQKLVADMGTTCPRVVNRWLSTYKVTNWFKLHRAELLHYIEKSNLNAAPPRIWWVYLVAVDAFTNATAVTFKYIQGSTMLINQQNAAFEKLVATLVEDVRIDGPLNDEAINLLNPITYVINGSFAVLKVNVREFLVGLASWVEDLIEESDPAVQAKLIHDVGSLFTVACDRITKICVFREADNRPYVAEDLLPPVLPPKLVTTRPGDFLRQVCVYNHRLQSRYSNEQVDIIADEHRALIMHYRTDDVVKQAIDSLRPTCSFEENWRVLGNASFPNLIEFCGVIATLFPGTCTVESDFSILRWEKDDFRKSLSDFGLQAVLQTKQYRAIQEM
ncbi:hypothetical protein MHU86_2095 [Fragilaria crotonensis]|nr:hypothetical protein MHU86_21539 [Fragilaria crotonensis]KAI2512219.1 hypothetical protein MHU86_2095 [Fragilaria crotonensis]